jgi:hypothetical protein
MEGVTMGKDLVELTERVEAAAESIVAWAWADSRVHMSKIAVAVALLQDMTTNGDRLPTEEECGQLVCGNLEPLREVFPNTDLLLARRIGS